MVTMIGIEKVMPACMIVMSLLAAAGYLFFGCGSAAEDGRRVVYWLAAAAITWSVTF